MDLFDVDLNDPGIDWEDPFDLDKDVFVGYHIVYMGIGRPLKHWPMIDDFWRYL